MPSGLQWLPWFSPKSLNYCSFANGRVFMLLFIWMKSLSQLTLSVQARELKSSHALYWFFLDYIIIFLSLDSCSNFLFLGLCWDTMDINVSLLSDKCLEMQHLAPGLLLRQPITVHMVMSFHGKTTFCANRHAQLCQLYHVIQSDMLTVYHSLTQLFLSHHLSLLAQCQLQRLSQLQYKSSNLVICSSWCEYCCWCYAPSMGLLFSGFWGLCIL